uniref:Metalloendopeptidase n=1 Tax=Strongyloides papillosus TaxID=174720 RepID=A0A0N5BMK5_STREA
MNKNFLIFILAMLSIYKNVKVTSKKASSKKLPELKARLPNTIHYYVDHSLAYASSIQEYFGWLKNRVCIKFVQQENEVTDIGINYFKTVNYSDIVLDKNLSKPTNIYLNDSDLNYYNMKPWCFFTGMALGLIPETTRYDRDSYVEVYKENIAKPYLKYYEKETTKRNYFGSFDYGSVMFPEKSFGGKNYAHTYREKSYPFYRGIIRMSYSFAVSDYRRLSQMYCKNQCPNLKGCYNRGYPFVFNGCQRCLCNEHFREPICETYRVHKHISCGIKTFYRSTSKKSYLTRKNVNGTCYYRIKSSNGRKVAITVYSLVCQKQKQEFGVCGTACLNIYHRSDWSISPLVICPNTSNVKIPALNKEVYIVFSKTILDSPANFKITYRSA